MSEPPASPLSAAKLERYLHEKIPLSRAMEVTVAELGRERLVLEAPLAPNLNHLGTAFGGSLQTLAILAGYAAGWTLMQESGLAGHVVVKRSTTNYRRPVTGRLRASCIRPATRTAEPFIADLRRHRKARLDLTTLIAGTAGEVAVEFHGTFVAFLDPA